MAPFVVEREVQPYDDEVPSGALNVIQLAISDICPCGCATVQLWSLHRLVRIRRCRLYRNPSQR